MRRSISAPPLTPLLVSSVPAFAAKPRPGGPPPACGLAVGNTWTYRSGSQQVTVKVLEVAPGRDHAGKPATTIVTEETFQGRTVNSTHTCTPTGA